MLISTVRILLPIPFINTEKSAPQSRVASGTYWMT